MANEISCSASLSFTKGSVGPVTFQKISARFTMAGTNFFEGTQSFGFSATAALGLGSVVTPGWILAVNLDTTNFIDLYTGTSGAIFVRLKPGEFFMGRLGCAAPAAKADTAAVVLQYLLVEA